MSSKVIFLKKSDAPVHSAGNIKLRWEPYAPRFSFVGTEDKAVIEALRDMVKTGVGAIIEVTEAELAEEKKNLKRPEPQVHRALEMHTGLSHESQKTNTSLLDAVDKEYDAPLGSGEPPPHRAAKVTAEEVRRKPSTAKRGEIEDAPQ